jgi:two-component system, response regulator PdtaR
VKPKRSALPVYHPVRSLPASGRRLPIVFSRDESSGPVKRQDVSGRLLIVEDDYLVALQMESALTEAGFEVVGVAASADEVFQLIGETSPTLALMDIRINGERDGIDIALELFREHGIRCVFATAHHTAEIRARARAARPLGWLPKPYTMPALVEAVRSGLRDLNPEQT